MGEALASILFTNLFWVGLWDLLDNTIFPDDTSGQMLLLVRAWRGCVLLCNRALTHTCGLPASQVVLGVAGLYVTDSLYDPPQDKFPQPPRRQTEEPQSIRMTLTHAAPFAGAAGDGDDDDGELLPLTGGTPECVCGLVCVALHVLMCLPPVPCFAETISTTSSTCRACRRALKSGASSSASSRQWPLCFSGRCA